MDTKGVFRRLSRKMLEDFSISTEINHQGSKGLYRENTLKRFLSEGRLPSRYGIGTGEIVGPAHNVSHQSDLIIYDRLNGISLIYDENTQVYPIECVAGTIEVKSTLGKAEFIKSLENIKSVKELSPRETTSRPVFGFHVAYPRPHPFGAVFGYRLGGNSLSSLVENLKEWEQDTPKEYWPNVIAILNEGLIYHHTTGLRIAYLNDDICKAEYPSSIHYREDALFKFYSMVIDLCTSTDLGPVVLSRYFDQAEQLGEYVVSNHDRIMRNDSDKVFKLSEDFIERVVQYCQKEGSLTQKELLIRRMGQIPVGMTQRDLDVSLFLYNPSGLKGMHEVKNPVAICDGMAIATKGMMDPCLQIDVNGEPYFIPWFYISRDDIEEIPGRSKSDL